MPIFSVACQLHSMVYERSLPRIRVLRRLFETHEIRAVIPPHGRLAVTDPLAWCEFAVRYFEDMYAALVDDFFDKKAKD